MTVTVSRPVGMDAERLRRCYRHEITYALRIGVTREDVALVVAAFAGEHPDPEEFAAALLQYVPAVSFAMDTDDA